MTNEQIFPNAKKSGYKSNKDVKFTYLDSIYIGKFRTLVDRKVVLGRNITLITGKNGTMKSSILGLIAHPFSSPNGAQDVFGKSLKTTMQDVFRMSLEKDNTDYRYYLTASTTTGKKISEAIRMYPRPDGGGHRITVSSDNQQGSGNFLLNTAYINLKRLFPIIDTAAKVVDVTGPAFSSKEKEWIRKAYLEIMTRDAFTEFDCISDYKDKNTLGPKNASYDFNSISSGEDNLGNILMKLLAFERAESHEDCLQGIMCIDELEASLHPVALTNLFDFLFDWSKKHRVQIVATTHSLYLLDHALKEQQKSEENRDKICLNVISTAMVNNDNYRILQNLSYKDAYKELTFKDSREESLYKVNMICEDEVAVALLKKILSKKVIVNNVDFISNISGISGKKGSSYTALISLAKNGAKLLEDSVIVLDPDVPEDAIRVIDKSKCNICKLPDAVTASSRKGMPIERSIVKFISKIEGDNPCFAKKEQMAYLDEFHHYKIVEKDIDTDNKIYKYKQWHDDHKVEYNTFLSLYVKSNKAIFDKFRDQLIKYINVKRSKKGLAML